MGWAQITLLLIKIKKNKKKEDRIKELEGENKDVDVEPTPATDNVQQWKRLACEELLKVFAPPGKAPLVTARAVCAYSCYDTRCSYKK